MAKALHQAVPVAAAEVHFRHEQKRGHPVQLQQPPQGAGVGLDPVHAADDQDGIVQHRQGPLHLGGKVHMARGVQQRHLHVPQRQLRLAEKNGNAPLPLQQMAVHGSTAVVHPAQLPQLTGAVEHGLGQGGLSRVHMGGDADDHPASLLVVHLHTRKPALLRFPLLWQMRRRCSRPDFSLPGRQIRAMMGETLRRGRIPS